MTDEDQLAERRTNRLHPAVLEYRVTALEKGQDEIKELVKEGFERISNRSGSHLDRSIIAIAALASVGGAIVTALHK